MFIVLQVFLSKFLQFFLNNFTFITKNSSGPAPYHNIVA